MLTHQTKQKPILAQVRPAYHRNVLESIGNTPLIRLNRVVFGVVAGTVLAKAEFFNPRARSKIGSGSRLSKAPKGKAGYDPVARSWKPPQEIPEPDWQWRQR